VAAIPPLIAALSDSSVSVRGWAAESLGSYYRQAKTAVPALLKARSDPDLNVREAVKVALDKIDPETAAMIPDLPDFKPLPPASGESP
jgi:HEAT repeat protein